MTTSAKVLYEFGPFRVDPEKQLLLRDNQPVPVTPKTFETLLLLVRHSREVVSKDELMKELWPDSFVEEANLSQNIFMLRKALGDSPEERRYIVTLPGKGYRFTAEVRTVMQDGDDVAIASRSRSEIALEQTDRAPAETISALPSPAKRIGWKHWLAIAAVRGVARWRGLPSVPPAPPGCIRCLTFFFWYLLISYWLVLLLLNFDWSRHWCSVGCCERRAFSGWRS